jgi:hypothetical protein
MSQDNGSATAMTAASNGRPIKFTPERFEQIKNLVERGISREEIAETIGVTLGSLQVTCSRMGISLRRRMPDLAIPVKRQPAAVTENGPPNVEISQTENPIERAKAAIRVQLSHGHRTIELKLPHDLLGRLAIEAHFENLTFSELISKLLTAALGGNSLAHV